MLVIWPFSGFPHPVARLMVVRCQIREKSGPSVSPQRLLARSERSSIQNCAELPFFSIFLSFSISGSVPEPTVQNVGRVLPVFRCPTEFALHRVKEDLKIFSHRNICAKSLCSNFRLHISIMVLLIRVRLRLSDLFWHPTTYGTK